MILTGKDIINVATHPVQNSKNICKNGQSCAFFKK